MNINEILKTGENANPNYLATICKIESTLPVVGADRLAKTVINGYDIVISKDMKPGDIVVYIPVESSICDEFLSKNNLYELSCYEKNTNHDEIEKLKVLLEAANKEESQKISNEIKSKCGFFNKHGRVRMIKLRGQYSMGYIIPWETFINTFGLELDPEIGYKFNMVNDIEFCTKYIPFTELKPNNHVGTGSGNKRNKKLKKFDKLIPGTFEFHYDTKQLGQYMDVLEPLDSVCVTTKLHGTSGIFSKLPIRRELSIFDKIKKFFGIKVREIEMGNIYSSRKVIKNQYINQGVSSGFYNMDVWGEVNKMIEPFLNDNMTIYGEIVGYVPGTRTCIQKNPDHDYGCKPGEWKFMPYRINENGHEWEVKQVILWTQNMIAKHSELRNNLMPMDLLYCGLVKDMYPAINYNDENWRNEFIECIKNDKDRFGMELDEPLCKNKVPREGIVIRINGDKLNRAWKVKTMRHYGIEAEQHDKGEVDMEDLG